MRVAHVIVDIPRARSTHPSTTPCPRRLDGVGGRRSCVLVDFGQPAGGRLCRPDSPTERPPDGLKPIDGRPRRAVLRASGCGHRALDRGHATSCPLSEALRLFTPARRHAPSRQDRRATATRGRCSAAAVGRGRRPVGRTDTRSRVRSLRPSVRPTQRAVARRARCGPASRRRARGRPRERGCRAQAPRGARCRQRSSAVAASATPTCRERSAPRHPTAVDGPGRVRSARSKRRSRGAAASSCSTA